MVGQEVGKGKPPRPARYTCAMARGLALPPVPPFPAGIAPSMPKQGTGALPAVAPLRLLRFAPKASRSLVFLGYQFDFYLQGYRQLHPGPLLRLPDGESRWDWAKRPLTRWYELRALPMRAGRSRAEPHGPL